MDWLRGFLGSSKSDGTNTDPRQAVYVHLRRDGGIFVVKGTGEELLATEPELLEIVRAVVANRAVVIYSRDDPRSDPPDEVTRLFREMLDLKPAFKLLDQPHPHAAVPRGGTSLLQAAFQDRADVVEDLVRRGAPVDAKDPDGMTALMYASNKGSASAAAALLAIGADANATDNEGNTPLMFAAQGGHEAIVDALLAAGADVRPEGKRGFRAYDFAKQNGHTGLLLRLTTPTAT
jgi:hypothetical protein